MKAVIFDFDGLILDTETAWYESYRKTLLEYYQFDLPLEEFVKCVGSDDTVLFVYLQEKLGDALDADLIRTRAKMWHTEKVKEAQAREGVAQYLEDARKADLKIALATSSTREWATTHLTNLNLISYFDHLITQDDVKRIKPAPDLFLKTLDVLGIQPHEGIVFEDSLNGLIAANRSNLPTVIIPNPVTEGLPFEKYHLKLTSMAEMSLDEVLQTLD
ncbi:HAD family hydrolase [Kroppenstedtia sanguinis]|uniref:HAD family hydrolase n=1 Tax=Kroppenstedtia sanguinis TaxID=1380684 RepID=A0ABW4CD03_9BACL